MTLLFQKNDRPLSKLSQLLRDDVHEPILLDLLVGHGTGEGPCAVALLVITILHLVEAEVIADLEHLEATVLEEAGDALVRVVEVVREDWWAIERSERRVRID
jgi:hypothetical protein